MNMAAGAPTRLIALTARTVWELDENGLWVQTQADEPVVDQFNRTADTQQLNPVGCPTITKFIHDEARKRTVYNTLCAVVINREVQAQEELAMRVRTLQALEAANTAVAQPQPERPTGE